MNLRILKPKKALNKAYLKVKPHRNEIETFKNHLISLLGRINEAETEEFHKNLVIDFLNSTYYKPEYFINTKGRNDLVIHNGKTAKTSVGVIIEAKSPINKAEMISTENLNRKAFQELVFYYLRERITHKNLEIKHLVATNINEWFIFNATTFDRLFAQNKNLVKQFNDFENGRLAGTKTDFFYKEIATPFIENLKAEIEFTHFNFQDYQKPLRNDSKADDNKLISLFKLLSPEHLLKLPFVNDSNSLDKKFYSELLHIIGLTETKSGSKKLIERSKGKDRNAGSIIENTITRLDSLDIIGRLNKPSQFGNNAEERHFNVALELTITWINRVLFLKLMEAQLLKYHNGNPDYAFLNAKKVGNYDDLNSLFFQVLAKPLKDRNDEVKNDFGKVPYLNSSLFESTDIERETLYIGMLKDDKTLPVHSQTVLKDQNGKKRKGEISTLQYLFEFLNAYDFSSEGSEEIQEENKTLINASVLGLIFEKINGYKDGSFFTPGFITTYMCRETIRKAVIQKFNETQDWHCQSIADIYDKIEDRNKANEIVNSLKICDPAVGSGHFLVSALNEIIAIKNDLKILQDRDGKRLKEYQVEVVNDELIITDEDGELFEYKPNKKESQRIQETLFHEKQTIIENCLFGVDINSNSVKICRLRLWIELLKNAYYKNETELETLPNIDINIKCGNSLISRFDIDSDLTKALKSIKYDIKAYRGFVSDYRNANNKEEKHGLRKLIDSIKNDFQVEISKSGKEFKNWKEAKDRLVALSTQTQLFELTAEQKKNFNKEVEQLSEKEEKYEKILNDIRNNKIYENAFEWRFEFPEVLNNDGDFVGFDAVIANPPYILVQSLNDNNIFDYYNQNFDTATYKIDTYALFYELGIQLLSQKGVLCFISPNTFLKNKHSKNLRKLLLSQSLDEIINFYTQVFDDASVDTLILLLTKEKIAANKFTFAAFRDNNLNLNGLKTIKHSQEDFKKDDFSLELGIDQDLRKLLNKIEEETEPLKYYGRSYFGIQTLNRKEFVSVEKINEDYYPTIDGGNIQRYFCLPNKEYVNFKKDAIKSGGDPNVYSKDRIVVRQIGKHPEGTIIPPNLMTLNTIYNIFLHKSDIDFLRYLLALINSKLFQFYWDKKYFDNKATFPKIKKAPLESLPIKTPIDKLKFSEIVNEIMILKQGDSETNTEDLEAQIDQMVYELYGLTEEEIKIIENA